MAEVLVRAVDNTHSDPVIDAVHCFKAGDVVFVAEDGHSWGSKEALPDFYVVKLPGVSQADVQHLTQHHHLEPAEFAPAAIKAVPRLLRGYLLGVPHRMKFQRRYRLRADKVAGSATQLTSVTIDDFEDKSHAA